jgi:hypothetical protein
MTPHALMRDGAVIRILPSQPAALAERLTAGDRVLPVIDQPVPAGHVPEPGGRPVVEIEGDRVLRRPPSRPETPAEAEARTRAARAAAYPPAGDQLDALWKALARDARALPPETRAMLDRVMQVKQQHPKEPSDA